MGTFTVEATVANLADPAMRVTLPLLVDTGATWTTLPGDIAVNIGVAPLGTRRVRLADGRVEEWPAAAVHIILDGHESPTFCLIGPRGGPSLLGAVTLRGVRPGRRSGRAAAGSGHRLFDVARRLIRYCGPLKP